MMKSKELRARAWESLRGKYWQAFAVTFVLGILVSLGSGSVSYSQSMSEIATAVDPSEMDATMALGAAVILGVAVVLCIIGMLLSIFVSNAATVGLANYFIKNTDGQPVFADAFSGFKVQYRRNIGTLLLMGIKLVLWSLLLVVPGIIKSFEYAMIPYILADDPEISCKEAFAKSKELMKGNKWRLFKLELSFIGWGLLCVVTFGVGALFLAPYLNAACAEFYAELKNNQN